jgi:hypothetical protein
MLENSFLYQQWLKAIEPLPARIQLDMGFHRLREVVSEHSKLIVRVLPEFTPHDSTHHLERLFPLADRILGVDLLTRLSGAELSLLVFGLFAHDWGMAVSQDEQDAIAGPNATSDPRTASSSEKSRFEKHRADGSALGKSESEIWEDYVRLTHAERSAHRLRAELLLLGQTFAEMAALVAEGHALDLREIRDPSRYPLQVALFGQTANVAAVATYVRIIDLFDLSEDRTPIALWSMIRPRNKLSQMEWAKHRALAPVAVVNQAGIRQVIISGTTSEPSVFAAIADLRAWVDGQFLEAVGFLRQLAQTYVLDLDSTIGWDIRAVGFEPVLMRFEFDRGAALRLLSREVYGDHVLAFVRELLQNSVDAIDTRAELLGKGSATLHGHISVVIAAEGDCLRLDWTDNGVGMDRHILETYFSSIGRSWYQSDEYRRRGGSLDPISKFGIGMLSCFAASESLEIGTRRDPAAARDKESWRLVIPSLDSYFRVFKESSAAPIGTTVTLRIPSSRGLEAIQIAEEIRAAAALVQHEISLTAGATELIRPVDVESHWPCVTAHTLGGDSAEDNDAIQTIRMKFVAPDGTHEAYYSAILPRNLDSLDSVDGETWHFANSTINWNSYIVHRPPSVLVKGIVNGDPHDLRQRNLTSATVNVFKPSLLSPDLSRFFVSTNGVPLDGFWDAAARKVAESWGGAVGETEHVARVISATTVLGGVPPANAARIVDSGEQPMWAMSAALGVEWRRLAEFVSREVVLEGPSELRYVLTSAQYSKAAFAASAAWAGPDCAILLGRHPALLWQAAALLAEDLLAELGFAPASLLLVQSPDSDPVPLCCAVWKKGRNEAHFHQHSWKNQIAHWIEDPAARPADVLQCLGQDYGNNEPRIVDFPLSLKSLAGVGSLYWNRKNEKIELIVQALLRLTMLYVENRLPPDARKTYEHLNSTQYLGYVVPARKASARSAILRFNELLKVAAAQNIENAAALRFQPVDFLEGTVEGYENPYHYNIGSWRNSKTPVGAVINSAELGKN